MRIGGKEQVEAFLKQYQYTENEVHFSRVWKKYQDMQGKEVFMSEKKGGFKVLAWVLSFLVVVGVGWFGLTKFSSVKTQEKIEKGEAIVVTLVMGEVQVQKMGSTEWRALFVDDVLAMGDKLKTAKDAYCEIQMVKRGIFRVESDSELLLATLENVDGKVQSRMKLEKGEIALNPKKLQKGETFEVETTTAVAAVRGTKFSVSSDANGSTKVSVVEGRVAVTPNIRSIEKATQDGLMTSKASEMLKEQLVKPVEVSPNEEVSLDKTQVEALDTAIGNAVTEIAKKDGPITEEKLAMAAPASPEEAPVSSALVQEIAVKAQQEMKTEAQPDQTVVDAVVQKATISEEAKQKLEKISTDRIIENMVDNVRVKFESNPAGAEVYLGERMIGTTPLEQIFVKGDKMELRIVKEGYDAFTQSLALNTPRMDVKADLSKIKTDEPAVAETTPTDGTVATAETKPGETVAAVEEKKEMPGDLVWNKPISFEKGVNDPVVYGGKVFTTVGNTLYVLSLEGSVLNKVQVIGGEGKLTRPVVANGTVYVGSDQGGIYAYTTSGELKWKGNAGKELYQSSPAAGSGIVAVPSVDQGIMVYTSGGSLKTSIKVSDQIFSSPYVSEDGKVVIYGTEKGEIVAYNVESNTELWRKSHIQKRIVFPMVGTENTVVVVSRDDGVVYGVDVTTGDLKWQRSFGELVKTKADPMFADGRVLLVSQDMTTVIGIYANSGKIAFSKSFNSKLSTVPFYYNNWVYVGTENGKVVGYDIKNKDTWTYSSGSAVSVVAADKEGVYAMTSSSMHKLIK